MCRGASSISIRTVIRGGWIVGYAGGSHHLLRNGVVVIQGTNVLDVVGSYDGTADVEIDARGALVMPGLIDTHVHPGTRASHRLIADTGRQELMGQVFLEHALTRPGRHAPGDFRYSEAQDAGRAADDVGALFTQVELLRNGITTFIDCGTRPSYLEKEAAVAERLGLRAYLGPGFQSSILVGREDGHWHRDTEYPRGKEEFQAAIDFVRRYDGAAGGRVRGLLFPRETDFCSPELLRATRAAADELKVPVQIHAAYNPSEFNTIVEEYGCTPIQYLARHDLLGPDVILGHCNLVAENPLSNWQDGGDLELIAQAGATVSYSPINLFRRGRSLDFQQYRRAGVSIALGTDTYPRDLIMNMRIASYVAKVQSRSVFAGTAAELFSAATLGGARALGREDLGRLAPGARADVTIVGLRAPDSLRWGVVYDPIKALVDTGIGDDVATVLVDGRVCMRDRSIPGISMAELSEAAQGAAERYWGDLQQWDILGRTAEQACPWAFPLLELPRSEPQA
ncbi:MAG: chlorohydrolase family protein [Chloroflexota bacterium]